MITLLLLMLACVALVLAIILIPLVIAAFFQMLPYLIVLAVLYWVLF